MKDWKSLLNDDPTDWLLEESNPSVRYFTLRWLLDLAEDHPDVERTAGQVAESAPIQKLLGSQRPGGYWGSDSRPFQGTQRYLLIMMWLGYQGEAGIGRAMEYLINGCLLDDGAFAIELKDRMVKLPCHGANLLRMMFWAGYEEDPRTKALLDWLVDIQKDDGVWPCVSKLRPFSCLWATADVLRAYRDLPSKWVSPAIEESRQLAIQLFLDSNLVRYAKERTSPRWFVFGFPLRFDSDILEVLELIAPYVSPEQEEIQEGLRLVLDKQDSNGRWPCEKHPKGGKWMTKFIEFEEIGQPSKWVTLHAMRMLKILHEG